MNRFLTKRNIIITVVLLIMTWALYYFFTHGIVDTTKLSGYTLTYQKINSDIPLEVAEKSPGIHFLSAGTYQLRFVKDNDVFSKTITVNKFFSIVSVNVGQYSQSEAVQTVANTRDFFIKTADGYTAFDRNSVDLLKQSTNDPFALTNRIENYSLTSLCTQLSIHKDQILCLYNDGVDGAEIQLALLHPQTNQISIIPTSISLSEETILHTNSLDDSFVLQDKQNIHFFTDTTTLAKSITTTKPIALGEATYLLSFTPSHIAIVSGKNYEAPNTDDEIESIKSSYQIDIYSTTTGAIDRSLTLHDQVDIKAISLSPDASKISINTDSGLRIIDTVSSNLRFATMLDSVRQTEWLDDTTLVYSANTNGIYGVNVSEGLSYPIFSTPSVNISSFSIRDKKIFTTGFFVQQISQELQGFTIDPQIKAVGSNDVYESIPYETSDYKIGISGNVISILPTVIEGNISDGSGIANQNSVISEARDYINSKLKDPTRFSIVEIN